MAVLVETAEFTIEALRFNSTVKRKCIGWIGPDGKHHRCDSPMTYVHGRGRRSKRCPHCHGKTIAWIRKQNNTL